MHLIDTFINPTFIVTILAAICAFATVLTITMPMLARDRMNHRMRTMAVERDKMRAERIAEMNTRDRQGSLRQAPKGFMQKIVNQLNLRKMLDTEDLRDRLKRAGLRGQAPLVAFMFFRVAAPTLFFGAAVFYLFVLGALAYPPLIKLMMALAAAFVGSYAPGLFISNLIQKRQQSIKMAFPDALDMLLICVQSGMSVEAAFGKVSKEIGGQSLELAEELSLTTAELSYLQDRRQAFDNLGKRTGIPGVKAVTTALIQAERYGTPVGQALRVMAKENRDIRQSEAEKKARGSAAQADRADDHLLSARAVRRDPGAGGDPVLAVGLRHSAPQRIAGAALRALPSRGVGLSAWPEPPSASRWPAHRRPSWWRVSRAAVFFGLAGGVLSSSTANCAAISDTDITFVGSAFGARCNLHGRRRLPLPTADDPRRVMLRHGVDRRHRLHVGDLLHRHRLNDWRFGDLRIRIPFGRQRIGVRHRLGVEFHDLTQEVGVLGGISHRDIACRNELCLVVFALQAEHERKVLADARRGGVGCGRLAKHGLGLAWLAVHGVGEGEIAQHGRLILRQRQRPLEQGDRFAVVALFGKGGAPR